MIEDCKNALHEIEEIVVTVLNWFGIDNVRYNVKVIMPTTTLGGESNSISNQTIINNK